MPCRIPASLALFLLLFAVACGGAMEPGDTMPAEEEPAEPAPGATEIAAVASPPPAPTSPPPALPTLSPAERVRQALAELTPGEILYNPPAEMRVGEPERIEVRIAPGTASAELPGFAEGLAGSGEPVVEPVRVSTFMKVRLSGDGFAIDPLRSEEQVVTPGDYTEWAWEVTPQRAGETRLFLTVTARVKLGDLGEEQKDLDVIERAIRVQVNPGYALLSLLDRYGDWLIPAVLLPLLAAAARWAWRRRAGNRLIE